MCVVVCEASPGILKAPKTHVAEFMFVLLHVHLHTVLHFIFFYSHFNALYGFLEVGVRC